MRRKLLCAAGLLAALAWVTNARGDLTAFRIGPTGETGVNGPAGFTNDSPAVGQITINCGGSDVWGSSDRGCYLYDPVNKVSGDFTAIVRVAAVNDPAPNWGRDGIHVRANDTTDNSPGVFVHRTSGQGIRVWQRAVVPAGDSEDANGTYPNAQIGPRIPNDQPVWLAMHRIGTDYYAQWAGDVGGAPSQFSHAFVMAAAAPNQGDMFAGIVHQRHFEDATRNSTAVFDNYFAGAADAGIIPTGLGPRLPGGPGGVGNWDMTEVRGLGGTGDVVIAYDYIASGAGNRTSALQPVINHTDPDTNPSAGIIGGDLPFLTNNPGDDNDIQMVAHGQMRVDGPTGRYTFGTHSDDGFYLRMWDVTAGGAGVPWASASGPLGAGAIGQLFGDNTILSFKDPTGDSNTRGSIDLVQGHVYDVEYVSYENGGGAHWELYAAQGEFANDGDTDTWRAIGAGTPERPVERKIRLTSPAVVANVNGGLRGAAPEFPDPDGVRTKILNGINGGTAFLRSDVTRIAVGDPQSGARQFAFPNDTPADDNNFMTGVFGDLEVTAGNAGNYVFHLGADDGLEMRIVGQDFTAATDFTGDGTAALRDIEGDMACSADYYTGNTNAQCLINLAEGAYSFEAFQYEGGGGAWLEIWYKMTDDVNAPFDGTWTLLDTGAPIPAVIGSTDLVLIPEPSTYLLAALAVLGAVLIRRRRK
jgi:hypothetical protein